MDIVRESRLKRSDINDIDEMSGNKFEEYLLVLLKGRGYKVKLTPKTGDYGADLILLTNNKKIVVQAKRYKKNVGVRAVQEIVSAQKYYKADECWVITNSFFTNQAIKLASSNHVRLINRSELIDWMIKYNKSA
ncbi:restriction endonuclease [Gracilibacillus oryzae]|uniref:Restriction endonuclease n=1 Tax=Gracilibacillus oryzae TaxID=1672701 RepID=A0A7C8KVG5_9BACI|nr:restriction endonuclease [Gracilibacillus oryzae]